VVVGTVVVVVVVAVVVDVDVVVAADVGDDAGVVVVVVTGGAIVEVSARSPAASGRAHPAVTAAADTANARAIVRGFSTF
jgi:hypothetical protein